ncbi:hypothetical protein [Streptomyces sp. NPDC056105]|uniref:hypothetical protein n=1 Tax=Streptomyces sp. NPDC056105 TaxID=3345714 RepID=UPI0035D5A316
MKADVLAVIDIYATAMQWMTWFWIGAAILITALAGVAVILIGRRVFDSFARAIRVIDDIREESQQS